MNFQDVIREVYDGDNKALKTTGNFSASLGGNVTLNPSSNHIGSVTIYGEVAVAGQATVTLNTGLAKIGFATVHLGTPTIFAVVNTSAAGTTDVTSDSGVTVYQGGTWTVTQTSAARTITGNVTLSDSKGFIGLTTVVQASSARSIIGNITLSDPKGFIGLVTVVGSLSAAAGNVTLDDGSLTGLVAGTAQIGSVTVSNPITIGNAMVTVTLGTSLDSTNDSVAIGAALPAGANYIGLATAVLDNTIFSPRAILTDALASPSVSQIASFLYGRNPVDGNWAFVNVVDHNMDVTSGPIAAGMVAEYDDASTSTVTENRFATLRMGSDRILYTKQAGTNKTLIPMPFALAGTSVATVAVPASTFKITHLLASANATVGVSIKSGATYLVGNASIRVSLNPNGGWVENGSPDSPVYVGLAGAAAIVIEKNDATTAVAGKVIYFDE